jgi:hypothetical protein
MGKNSLSSPRGARKTSRVTKKVRRKFSSTVAGLFPAFILCNVLDEAGQIDQNQPPCHHDRQRFSTRRTTLLRRWRQTLAASRIPDPIFTLLPPAYCAGKKDFGALNEHEIILE